MSIAAANRQIELIKGQINMSNIQLNGHFNEFVKYSNKVWTIISMSAPWTLQTEWKQ